jgi:mannosyltransferase
MAITVATKRLRARDAGFPAGTYPTALVALTVLAFALAFHEIGAKSLNLDESTSLLYAREPVSQLWEVVSGGDPNGGLYYVLLNAWTRVFGDGEVAGRALIAVVAGLTVPAVALLGGRLFGRLAGLVAGLLLALDGFFVQYAQTARSYILAALLVTVSSYFFVAELERPSRSHKVGYVLARSVAIYAHSFDA